MSLRRGRLSSIQICVLWERVPEWYFSAAHARTHSVPPTDSIVSCGRKHSGQDPQDKKLTKGDAVGPSRTANSSSVNGSLGMTIVRKGMSSEITIGNPIAAGNVLVSGQL